MMAKKKETDDIAALLGDEADAIDSDRDAPIDGSTVSRGRGRSKTLQVRLNPEELEELERVAESRGLPTSTVAREAILDLIRPSRARPALADRMVSDFAKYLDVVAREAPGGRASFDTALPEAIVKQQRQFQAEMTKILTSQIESTVREVIDALGRDRDMTNRTSN